MAPNIGGAFLSTEGRKKGSVDWILRPESISAMKREKLAELYNAEISKNISAIENEVELYEGIKRRVNENKYERNPKARLDCIKHHGPTCKICGFDFLKVYGPVGEGIIHVHHLRPLSEGGNSNYRVDPVNDLIPICPNCHAIIHRNKQPYSVDEVKDMLEVLDFNSV